MSPTCIDGKIESGCKPCIRVGHWGTIDGGRPRDQIRTRQIRQMFIDHSHRLHDYAVCVHWLVSLKTSKK